MNSVSQVRFKLPKSHHTAPFLDIMMSTQILIREEQNNLWVSNQFVFDDAKAALDLSGARISNHMAK